MNRKVLAVLAGTLLAAAPLAAHHSFTATYDETKEIELEGTLVAFMFRNPHSFVHLMAPDENGEMHRWAIEWGAAGVLDRQGVSRDSLRVGDHVVVTGNPGRSAIDHRVRHADAAASGRRFRLGQERRDFRVGKMRSSGPAAARVRYSRILRAFARVGRESGDLDTSTRSRPNCFASAVPSVRATSASTDSPIR